MFYVLGNYALSGLLVRGMSAIQGFLMYTSTGSLIGTRVNIRYNLGIRHSEVSVKRGSTVIPSSLCLIQCLLKL